MSNNFEPKKYHLVIEISCDDGLLCSKSSFKC